MIMFRCLVWMLVFRKVVMFGWNEESFSVFEDMLVLVLFGLSIIFINNYEFDKSILKGNMNCNVKYVVMDV